MYIIYTTTVTKGDFKHMPSHKANYNSTMPSLLFVIVCHAKLQFIVEKHESFNILTGNL